MCGSANVLRVSVLFGLVLLSLGRAGAAPPRESSVATSRPTAPAPGMLLAVAVLPFQAADEALAAQLSDIVSADLARGDRVNLVERARLGEVLAELGLSDSGISDAETAQRVGFLVGAKVLVWGRVITIDRQKMIIGRVVGVETGRVFVEQVRGSEADDLVPLIDRLAARLAHRITAERAALVAPEERDGLQASLNALAEKLRGRPLPKLALLTDQGALVAGSSASVVSNELTLWLTRCGLSVTSVAPQTSLPRPWAGEARQPDTARLPDTLPDDVAVLLVAEISTEPAGVYGPLHAVRYRLQVRAMDPCTKRVIAVAQRTGACAGVTAGSASDSGLREATRSVSLDLIPRLAGYAAGAPPQAPR